MTKLSVEKYVKQKISVLLRNTPGIPRIGSNGRTAQSIAIDYEEDLMSAAELALQMILNDPGKPDVDKLRLEIDKQMRQTIKEIGLTKILKSKKKNWKYIENRTKSECYSLLTDSEGKQTEAYEHKDQTAFEFFRYLTPDEWLVLKLTHDRELPFATMWKAMKCRACRRKSKKLFRESCARKVIDEFAVHLQHVNENKNFCVKEVHRAMKKCQLCI